MANLRHRIDLMKNVSFDDCENYLISGRNADLIISDFSSMLIEFYSLINQLYIVEKAIILIL